MANFLTLVFALFAMMAFGELFVIETAFRYERTAKLLEPTRCFFGDHSFFAATDFDGEFA